MAVLLLLLCVGMLAGMRLVSALILVVAVLGEPVQEKAVQPQGQTNEVHRKTDTYTCAPFLQAIPNGRYQSSYYVFCYTETYTGNNVYEVGDMAPRATAVDHVGGSRQLDRDNEDGWKSGYHQAALKKRQEARLYTDVLSHPVFPSHGCRA